MDDLLLGSKRARRIVREVHPEICFWAFAQREAMQHRKNSSAGFRERLSLLANFHASAQEDFNQVRVTFRSWDLADDDILDAMAAAVTASANRVSLGTVPRFPPLDCYGLPMEMVYRREP